jgi:FlaA1/EpsC-like NDP-sugar epimerase
MLPAGLELPMLRTRDLRAKWWPFVADLSAWLVGLAAARHFSLTVLLLAVLLHAGVGYAHHLYRGRHPIGSFEEVRAVTGTVVTTAAVLVVLDALPTHRDVPLDEPVLGAAVALVLMLAVRYVWRLRVANRQRPDVRTAVPVLLFGAGRAATVLVRSMLHDPDGRYLPVGLLDDDPAKRNLHVHGVPVLGRREDLPSVLSRTGAATVVLAVANAEAGLVRDIRDRAVAAGAGFKVVPSVPELMDHPVGVRDIRDVQITDLLGRHQIDTDLDSIAGYLTGKRVLVTGAGGSIGSELCRQIHRFAPAELMMLDRDESSLLAVQLSIDPAARLDDPAVILADLRDAARIRAIFAERRPQVVFHAAALKHLALLQRFPGEALLTNIQGTLNVLEAAIGVERFVNISTDKAANPVSVLGASKRITERLTAEMARRRAGTFLSVRFGNVLGSRGSVFTTFSAQIAAGGPITVTDPEVTRYFMTIQEAVHLVIQAAAIGRGGEALVLEMGRPVRIAEVAAQMAALAPAPVEIRYIGLGPGEKLAEELFGAGEVDRRPIHPLISHVTVPPLPFSRVVALDPAAPDLAARLHALCSSIPELVS